MSPLVALSIAGTDSGGAAGLGADLTTFAAHGLHGAMVVTAVTAQDTTGVHAVHALPPSQVAAQLDAVLDDLPVAVVKTGMLGSAEIVDRVVWSRTRPGAPWATRPLVVDPVLRATSGAVLGDDEVARAYVERLLPVATVVTPNLDESRILAGLPDAAPDEVARKLAALGCAVVVTGGPAGSEPVGQAPCTDWLCHPDGEPVALTHPAVETTNDHGTGCTFSAALAAHLARDPDLAQAVRRAAAYTTRQLHLSQTWTLGRGRGPIAHIQGES